MLLSIVGLLVLIACANVAMVLLAQAEGRKREIAIRLAIGSGRWRLARQLLGESALLAAFGGAMALLVVRWMVPLIPAVLPPGPDFFRYDLRLDARVMLFTAVTCMAAVLVFGLAPALGAARTDLNSVLKGGAQKRRRFAGRSLLVAAQAALSVVLLSSAGLLARSFLNSQRLPLGFDSHRNMLLVLVGVDAPRPRTADACDQIVERLRALPGVKQAAYCRRAPMGLSGGGASRDVVIPGRPVPPDQEKLHIRFNQVSPEYFAATGTRLLSGRTLERADAASAPRVAMVNQTMAEQYWPARSALGEWIQVDGADTQIVGVVENGPIRGVHEKPEPFLYFPFAQMPVGEVTFLVETAREAGPLLPAVKREMRAANPGLIVLMTNTLKQHLKDALYGDWLPAVLAATIGLLGMVLAAAGLFGVVMHWVNRGLRELGIRATLGAGAADLVAMVLRHGLLLAGVGAAAGAAASLGAGRLIAGSLYGVGPYDPATLALSVGIVLAVALVASFYPAWKATRVDPADVLRTD